MSTLRNKYILTVLVVLGAALLLAACGAEKEPVLEEITASEEAEALKPSPSPTPTPSPSPSPTPEPTPTPLPEPRVVIVLDPGHGGKRTGAWYDGQQEKNLTLKIANYARSYLLEHYSDVAVYLTREEDVALDEDLAVDLEMRAIIAEQYGADALISIHLNATDAHIQHGTIAFCTRDKELNQITIDLANCMLAHFEALGLKNLAANTKKSNDMFDENGVAIDYYAINRHCTARRIPSVIVEQCFMDSEPDKNFLFSEEGLMQLAEADALGIADYFQLTPYETEDEAAAAQP